MTVVVPDWIATNAAWVAVVSLAGGYGTYLLKKSRTKEKPQGAVLYRRENDKVIEELVTLVKEDVAAFQALKSQGEDHKNISIKICDVMGKIETSIALVNAGLQQLLSREPEPSPAHHGRTR